jgi:hypothetical protein
MKLKYLLCSISLVVGQFMAYSQEDDEPKRGSQFTMLLNVDSPMKGVMPDMSTTGLFGVGFGQSPFYGSPFYIEFKAFWGNYGRETQNNVYYEKSGWLYPADSRYASGYQKYLLGTKVMVGKDFRKVRAFVTPQIGLLRMRSRAIINWTEDGTVDDNGLGPNEARKNFVAETGFVYGGEAGVEIAIDKLLKIPSDKQVFRLVISGSYIMSSNEYQYADVDKMISSAAVPDNSLNYVQSSYPKQWEKYSAEVFSSTLALWGVNVGLIINF